MELTHKEIAERLRILQKEIRDIKEFYLENIEKELKMLKSKIDDCNV